MVVRSNRFQQFTMAAFSLRSSHHLNGQKSVSNRGCQRLPTDRQLALPNNSEFTLHSSQHSSPHSPFPTISRAKGLRQVYYFADEWRSELKNFWLRRSLMMHHCDWSADSVGWEKFAILKCDLSVCTNSCRPASSFSLSWTRSKSKIMTNQKKNEGCLKQHPLHNSPLRASGHSLIACNGS